MLQREFGASDTRAATFRQFPALPFVAQIMLVFSYGSNMLTARIKARVPSATPVATGCVTGRRFVFHKRSEDGSAKADAFHTGDCADKVWGVLFEVSTLEKPILDACEFLGVGYDEQTVKVRLTDAREIRANLYVARPSAIEFGLMPYSWYQQFVIQGAREHRLPSDYIEFLIRFTSRRDPDTDRHERNQRLLGG